MSFGINNLLDKINSLPDNRLFFDPKPVTSAETNSIRENKPDFEVYTNTTVSVPLSKDDTQYDFARRGYIAHARNAGLTEGEQTKFADDMLAGRSRETMHLVSSSGKTVGDEKFALDKKGGKKEFYLTDRQLTELQRRQKESYANRQPTINENITKRDGVDQAGIKRTQLEQKYQAQSAIPIDVMSGRDSNVERTVTAATDLIESATGENPNTIGAVFNRQAVSSLKVLGEAADLIGATETGQALKNASTEVTRSDERNAELLEKNGLEPHWEAGLQQEMQRTPEFVRDVIKGIVEGDFSEDNTFGVKIGQIVGGLNPLGDIRDIIANGEKVYKGEDGAWIVLGASVVGAIPIIGDTGKIVMKAEKEVIAETVEKLVKGGVEKEAAEKLAKEEVEKLTKEAEAEIAKQQAKSSGKLILENGRSLSASEKEFADKMVAEGRIVKAPKEVNVQNVKNPDFEIDGEIVEFKYISDLKGKDVDTLSGGLSRRILDGGSQASKVSLNATDQVGMTKEVAERAVKRAFGSLRKRGSEAIKEVRIYGKDFDITFTYEK